jgi:hypothetical protein
VYREFGLLSGTSMSGPHVAGSAALMMALYPDWGPGEVKSALMTTATVDGVTKEDGVTPVDAFDVGSGRVALSSAMNPGVTISDSVANYFLLEEQLWNSNYPSIFLPDMPGIMTVERTLQSQLERPVAYRVSVEAPEDVTVDTGPSIYVVRAGDERTMTITVDASRVPEGEVRFATLYLRGIGPLNRDLLVRIPITIVRGQDVVTIDQSCEPTTLYMRSHTTSACTVTIENTSFEGEANYDVFNMLPRRLRLINGSVVGATQVNGRTFAGSGTLAAAAPPEVGVAIDPLASPSGYLPLSLFGGTWYSMPAMNPSATSMFRRSPSPAKPTARSASSPTVTSWSAAAPARMLISSTARCRMAPPNNTLAPFWTDLNPSDGGRFS